MRPKTFIPTVQRRLAATAIGPSTLRGQGKGVLKASQRFLSALQLGCIPRSNEAGFRRWLDRETDRLLNGLPIKGRPWGAARKGINLFLRDSLYNQYLTRHFRITELERWLEIPLDRIVAQGLKSEAGRGNLPPWPGLKYLTSDVNEEFQTFAAACARKMGFHRVHLDMYLWLKKR